MPNTHQLLLILILTILLAACSPTAQTAPTNTFSDANLPAEPGLKLSPTPPQDAFSSLPEEARQATRSGDPRPVAYWLLWNSCAPENRADVAAANGGRADGWILMDDLIADPGIQLGDYPLETCQQGLTVLQGSSTGPLAASPVFELTAQLLAAELNLNVGAESCPIAEEAVLGSHLVLSDLGFDGTAMDNPSAEVASAIPRLVELLEGYNRGDLCR